MKRAVCLLVLGASLVTACSHSTKKATPSPTPSPTAVASEDPRPTASPTAAPTHTAAPEGPAGTKVPSGFTPMSATFVSDRTGWVLGSAPCPSGKGRCDVVARTRDGGATWRAIPSPRTGPEHLAQVRFADERNGFITGDRLWATHDGGASWHVVRNSDVQLAAAAGRAWISEDGRLYSAPATGDDFALEPAGSHVQSFVVHGSEAVYSDGTALYRLPHQGSPQRVSVPCASGSVPVVGLGSRTHWFLVCEGDAGLGHQDKQAFESFDAGRTWKPAGTPPALTGTDVFVTAEGTFVVDHQEVAGYRSGSWRPVLSTDGGVVEGGFESSALGYCIGGFGSESAAAMKVTHDGGRSWQTVAF